MSSPQSSPLPDVEGLIAELDRAHEELCAAVKRQWNGQHALKLSIPARPDADTDLIIGSALRHARNLLAGVSAPARQEQENLHDAPRDTLQTDRPRR